MDKQIFNLVSSNRDIRLDIMKGIGIMLVVCIPFIEIINRKMKWMLGKI